jgi:hypothetical protein
MSPLLCLLNKYNPMDYHQNLTPFPLRVETLSLEHPRILWDNPNAPRQREIIYKVELKRKREKLVFLFSHL